jgi:Mn-containing catalase
VAGTFASGYGKFAAGRARACASGSARSSYAFISTHRDGVEDPQERWTSGRSIDGQGEFTFRRAEPLGGMPVLAPAPEESHPQLEEMTAAPRRR